MQRGTAEIWTRIMCALPQSDVIRMIRSAEGIFERSPTALYDTYITSEDA